MECGSLGVQTLRSLLNSRFYKKYFHPLHSDTSKLQYNEGIFVFCPAAYMSFVRLLRQR